MRKLAGQNPATDLPLFVYGSLRPDELAWRQIACLVAERRPAVAEGLRLSVRDGLPFAHQEDGAVVDGDVLWARRDQVDEFYARVRAYEGRDLYSETGWTVRAADGRELPARVFVGKRISKGSPQQLDEQWTSARDPLFSVGLDAITAAGRRHFETVQHGWPADHPEFWGQFLPLQGLYLVLCTVLERYTALVSGPTKLPTQRIKDLRTDPEATKAVRAADPPSFEVFNGLDPSEKVKAPGPKSFDAWYQVRCNLTHRGKAGGFHDFEIVEKAVVGLHDSMRHLLARQLPLEKAERSAYAARDNLLGGVYQATRHA